MDDDDQLAIVKSALGLLVSAQSPGEIADLGKVWTPEDSWKDRVMRPREGADGERAAEDDRIERLDTPQYQTDADRAAAARAPGCPGCLWVG